MDDATRDALLAKYEKPTTALIPLPWRHSPKAGLYLTCLIVFIGLLLSLKMPLQRSDDFYKIIGAWSLAAGQGYSDISRPDAPFLTKYPPLASLLMAPLMSLAGDFLRPLRLLAIFSYLASLPLVYHLLLPRAGHRRSLLILLVSGLNPLTLRILNFEGNGGIMALFVIGAIALLERTQKWSYRHAVCLAALLTLYFYSHRIGIVFGAGSLLYLFFVARERRFALLVAIVFLTLSFPWLWRSYTISGHWISQEYEAEIVGRSVERANMRTPGPLAFAQHVLGEAQQFPSQVGYYLFPWSRASGGTPWPFLERNRLVWVASLTEWVIGALVLIGWIGALRARRFSDLYLLLHSLMLMAFFFTFQYFQMFTPWFYLYLSEGAKRVLGRLWPKVSWPAYLAILLVLLAKDTKAFWLMPLQFQDRDLRWSWVAKVVPSSEAVYYLGLDNYAFSQLRYFDSGRRMAVGITQEELEKVLADTTHPARWICLPKTAPQNQALQRAGWQPVVAEPESVRPSEKQLEGRELSAAQRAFLEMMEPPQLLWHRL